MTRQLLYLAPRCHHDDDDNEAGGDDEDAADVDDGDDDDDDGWSSRAERTQGSDQRLPAGVRRATGWLMDQSGDGSAESETATLWCSARLTAGSHRQP